MLFYCYYYSFISCESRLTVIGNSYNNVHRTFPLGLGNDKPGFGLIGILYFQGVTCTGRSYVEGSGLGIIEPGIRKFVTVGVAAAFGTKLDAIAYLGSDFLGRREFHHGRVVGVFVIVDRPVHASGEIVLIGFAPAPYRGFVAGVPGAVDTHDLILCIGPDRTGVFGLDKPTFG